MRLTVGPHPAAVYWRRRAVVLIAIAMVVLVISYACSGTGTSSAGPGAQPTTTSTPTATPTPSRSLLHPTSGTPTPSTTPFTLPPSVQSGPCTDTEMDLVAKASSSAVNSGEAVNFTIKIKNISKRTCSRDIGADLQELRLTEGTAVMWSSDDCGGNSGHDVRSFAAGREVSFTLTWQGRRSRSGAGAKLCGANPPAPAAGIYQLVARLDQKLSAPVDLQIRS